MLTDYTDQQSRIDRAFSHGGSCCSTYCEACGRTYFVTSDGHGDYDEGELEDLLELAEEQPDKYIEVPDYSSVATMHMPFSGKQVVVGCECDPTRELSEFIERYAEELTAYLRYYWNDTRKAAEYERNKADEALAAFGWMPMSLAPKNATWVEVETHDGKILQAHWASDLSGEEQPSFQGWFTGDRDGDSPYHQVRPIHWRPLEKEDQTQ